MTLSKPNTIYEQDFNLWLEQTVALLKARRFGELDLELLIDELESVAKRDKREMLSRLDVILMHLLKWQYQPNCRTVSWESSIQNNRKEILRLIEDSPSLKSYPVEILSKAYQSARKDAARETQLPQDTFPMDCPFSINEALSDTFWPEDP
jgi:Domain of unknown function DUF29